MKKNILRIICIMAGAAITVNGICLMLRANITTGTWLTIILGLALLLPSLFIKHTKRLMKHTFFKCLAVCIILGTTTMLSTTLFLYFYGNNNNSTYNEDYLLILGCGVRGEEPSSALRERLDTALEYLKKNESCRIIVSGGQGRDERISEAEAMRRYLTANGISGSRILSEDKSTSTTENFKFSNSLTDGELADSSAVFITNDFHIYRASSLARLQGFSMNHIGAPTAWYNIFPSYLREFLAIGQMYLLNK
ncbi:MAG: YdcF family protein [Clostridiales bacterium]|nr:YdcF family protein [Clostridiales bacterium]